MKPMYGILCESDEGLDAFGNPIGKPILMEQVGALGIYEVTGMANRIAKSNSFGRVIVVEIVPVKEITLPPKD